MQLQKQQTNINQLQKNVSQIAGDVNSNPKRIYEVLKYADPVGYFISPQLASILFDHLEELEMLDDADLLESIKEAKREIKDGGGHDLTDVLDRLDK